jgi:nicotinamide-nucleotide amidase
MLRIEMSVGRTVRWLQECAFLWLLLQAVVPSSQAEERPALPTGTITDYSIIVTGNELLTGVYADGHTHFVTRTLRPLGLRCIFSVSVDDQAVDIQQALRFARDRSQLIIVTGGLGPTDSDITREVLSEYTGISLRESEEVLGDMERRYRTPRDRLRPNLRRQARVPVQGTFLKNPTGSAVGLVYELEDVVVAALPGPPRELQPMVKNELIPYLTRRFGTRRMGCSITIRFVGLGQSQIDQTMEDHIQLPAEVMQSTQFESGRVDFTFTLPENRPQDRASLERLRSELHKYLGESIYADNAETTLEECVANQFLRSGSSIALAEVGSGGSLAAGIGRTKNAKNVLAGGFVAPTENSLRRMLGVPEHGWSTASPVQRVNLIAVAVAEGVKSDWVVVVGQPQPDPQKRSQHVHVVVRQPDGDLSVRQLRWSGVSPAAQRRLVTDLLDHLRRVCVDHS